jgi:hypothetical protein
MSLKKNVLAHVPHSELTTKIWDKNKKMLSNFREALLRISDEFVKYLGIDLDVVDVIMTGSYANYNYTSYSDIDLHVVIDFDSINDDSDLVEEFFNAKRSFWNNRHDIELRGVEVELYPQDEKETHASSGVYSITNDDWVTEPRKFRTQIDVDSILRKSEKIQKEINIAIRDAKEENSTDPVNNSIKKIKKMRKSGLERAGELSDENIVYKVIRSKGLLQALFDTRDNIRDEKLSKI